MFTNDVDRFDMVVSYLTTLTIPFDSVPSWSGASLIVPGTTPEEDILVGVTIGTLDCAFCEYILVVVSLSEGMRIHCFPRQLCFHNIIGCSSLTLTAYVIYHIHFPR